MGLNAFPKSLIGCAAASLLLAGCGYKSNVTRIEPAQSNLGQPVSDTPAPDKAALRAARAAEKQRVEKGLTPSAQSRPTRVDDLTVSLDVRPEDPFNLPPEGTEGGASVPFPGDPQPMAVPHDPLSHAGPAADAARDAHTQPTAANADPEA